jgi:hypothetical protein
MKAPGGNLTVASVPGSNWVRISQAGQLLSLEIEPSQIANPQSPISTSQSLAQLLTGGGGSSATGLTVNGDGTVQLTGSGIPVADGDVVVSKVQAQTATLTASHNLTLVESQLKTTGDLNLLAKDTVRVIDSVANPFVAQAGGKLTLQGNQGADIFALNNSGSGFFSGKDMLLRSANTVGGDALFIAGGNFRVEQLDGSLGNLSSPHDPVFEVAGDYSVANYSGGSLQILAGGSVNIPGNVTINDVGGPFNDSTVTLSNGTSLSISGSNLPTLDIRAGTTRFFGRPTPGSPTSANITIGSIKIIAVVDGGPRSLVFLTTQYFPDTSLPGGSIQVNGAIDTSSGDGYGGTVVLDSRAGITVSSINTSNVGSSFGPPGDVTLLAQNDINVDSVDGINSSTDTDNGENSGTIILNSANGAINIAGNLNASAGTGYGGEIILTAAGDINTLAIDTHAIYNLSAGKGNITLTSNSGSINTNGASIDSYSDSGKGGVVTLTATNGAIATGSINSSSGSDFNAGSVTLNAGTGNITIEGDINSSAKGGIGQDISLTGNLLLGNNATFTTTGFSGNGNINVTGTLNGTAVGGQNLTLNAGTTGNITFGNAIGDSTPIGNLSVNSANNVTLNGNISTTSNSTIRFNSPVTFNSDATLTADEIEFNENISGGGVKLGLQPATVSRGIQIGRNSALPGNLNLTATQLDRLQNGFGSITIGREDGSGTITIDSAGVTFNTPVTIQTGTGTITTNGAIAGLGNASVTLIGQTNLNANITTADQNITINGNTTLNNDVTLSTGSSGGGNILIDGTIDGSQNLILETGSGKITVTDAMGGNTRLDDLTINNANNLTTGAITAASINQVAGSGNTTFNGVLNTNSTSGINLTGTNFTFNDPVTTTNNGKVTLNNSGLLSIVAGANMSLDGAFSQTESDRNWSRFYRKRHNHQQPGHPV